MKIKVKRTRFGYKIVEKKRDDYIIYCLYCPTEKAIIYIGRSSQELRIRLIGHINDSFSGTSKKSLWLNDVIKKHKAVYARVLFSCKGELKAKQLERELINRISQKRYLVNTDCTGKGYGLARTIN